KPPPKSPPGPTPIRAGAVLTNMLPAGAQSVFALNLANVKASPVGDAAFKPPGVFADDGVRAALGFALQKVDAIYRADSFKEKDRWSFTVLHTTEPIDKADLTKALGLKGVTAIEKQDYFEVTKNQDWLLNLP